MFLARSALVLVAVLAAGCPKDPPDDPCQLGFVGDKTAQPSIEIIYLYADGTVRPAAEGGEAPLIEPPQGGRVIFAGIRARNVDACAATLSGALRDTQSNRVMLDQRTTNLVAQDGGTAGSTGDEASTFANVPVCPNQWSARDVFDLEYQLEITLTDRGGRRAMKTRKVRPFCSEPEASKLAECRCICKLGYVLGEPCGVDGGVSDGGP